MARPTKLTPKLSAAIVARISAGDHVETAAARNGIHKDTYYRWMRDGARERQRIESGGAIPKRNGRTIPKTEQARLKLCAAFSDACERACAEVEGDGVEAWRASFKRNVFNKDGELVGTETDWRAVQAYMERRFPDRWKPRSEQALTGPDGGPIQTESTAPDLSKLTKDELREYHRLALKAEIPTPQEEQ